MNISEYIISKLREQDCFHVVGIPGTSCADFFNTIDNDESMSYIIPVNELEAGYIADGYGRTGSPGAVCVSYGVGTLSLVNAVASAFTERVPLIVINGGPSASDLEIEESLGVLFSHSTGRPKTDYFIFKQVTAAASIVSSINDAQEIIDFVFEQCRSHQRPVYLEVPRDFWLEEIVVESGAQYETPNDSDNHTLLGIIRRRILKARSPVLFIGVELVRLDLHREVVSLIEKWNIPFVTTALSKSILKESHPNFIGCYDSDLFHKKVFEKVDKADCLICLGCIWGVDHRVLVTTQSSNMIDISFGQARVDKEKYYHVNTGKILAELLSFNLNFESDLEETTTALSTSKQGRTTLSQTKDNFGHDQVFQCINDFLKGHNDIQVIMDTCLGSFPGADLNMPNTQMYLANPIWLSIGQSIPAAIGAYLRNNKPPVIISGDGGFQMMAQTFSTMVKYDIPALIIILDNSLYAIEQYLIDDSYFREAGQKPLKYVELNRWSYEDFPGVFGGGLGYRVRSQHELRRVLDQWSKLPTPWIVACEIPKKDLPSNHTVKSWNY